MHNVTFFRDVAQEFGEETLYRICKNITYEIKPPGGVVFKQGAPSHIAKVFLNFL